MHNKKAHLKVQFGCGLCTPNGWLNCDSTPTLFISKLPFARSMASLILGLPIIRHGTSQQRFLINLRDTKALYGDIAKGLPIPKQSATHLYASHVLEHLPLKSARKALLECRRVLAPNGIFRVVVPNLRFLIDSYLEDCSNEAALSFCLKSGMGSENIESVWHRIRGDKHHIMYDERSLKFMLLEAGFSSVRKARYGDSIADFSDVECFERWREPENLGFECRN